MADSAAGMRMRFSGGSMNWVMGIGPIKTRNKKDQEEEVDSKSTLKWYKLERMVQGWQGM